MSKSLYSSVAKLNLAGSNRKVRRIFAEDLEWSLATVPRLSKLCLETIVRNFEEHPIVEKLPPGQRDYVLERLSPLLPLHVTASLISDERYWKRCCKQRWDPCDTSQYGHSWKRMFLERHLENIIELFVPDVTDPKTVLDLVPLCKNYVKRLNISQLLLPIKEPQQAEEEECLDSASDSGSDRPSMDHFDFGILLDKLTSLEELHLMYRVKDCGMNFEWKMFEITLRDCESLAWALMSCKTLKVLRLQQSKVEDEKCRMLVRHLLDHPSLRELDFSHNLIGDRGARAVSKLLNRSKLETLNIYDNDIRGPGAQAIASALSKNSTLLSLNLRLNRLGDEGGQAIGKALRWNHTLLHLHLGANEMTEPTAAVLAKALAQNNTLKTINLSCNRLGEDGGKLLEDGMSHNISITECDIRLTEVGQEADCSISQVVQNNRDREHERRAPENGAG
ncbi:dynein regulatory complex subunit 5 [Lampris incognitus]|uniref:dynein regulatory complex subunit 5 n=1 Tax=Lampris incognitus TaxID=2546036 RepID=UPI0024B549E0|nr:dynein regulatory complex subunit 5 [Lampris incognitus]